MPIVDEDISSQDVLFQCNADGPTEHETGMWCCNRRFQSLSALRQHFIEAGSFLDTRLATMNRLKVAMDGDADARHVIFEEPLRGQIAAVLDENNTWLLAMFERLKRHVDTTEDIRPKRPRRQL